MKMNKRFLSLTLALVMVLGSLASLTPVLAAETAVELSDIDGHWAEAHIKKAVEEGLVKGYKDGTFKPGASLARAEMATILARAFELKDEASLKDFTDVKSTDWFYSAMAKAVEAGIFKGDGDKLMPTENIRRDHAFATLARALKLEKAEEFNKAFPDLDEMDQSVKGEVAALVNRGYVEGDQNGKLNPAGEITRAEMTKIVNLALGFVIEDEEEPEELEVESVSAINAKEMKVTFNRAVEDTTKAVFGVKRGTTTVSGLEVSWNEAKTEATLTSGVNLPAGDYTVTVTGLTEEALTATVKVEAQKVTEIKFLSNDLVKSTTSGQATFTYKVLDQYGTDITKTVANSAISKSVVVGSTTGTLNLDPAKGIATVNKGSAFVDSDKKAVVTLVHAASGTTATATMDIVAAATVESLTFGENILPEGKTNIETGLAEAVKVPVTVKDQYGNTIKDLATLNGALTPVSSNTSVVPTFTVDSDNNTFVVLDTTALTTKQTVVLTIINPSTGKSFAKTFEIVKASAPYAIELGELSKQTIANGDTGITLPITVTDQFGNQLTKDQIVANKTAIEAWITGDGATTPVTNFTIVTDKNSKDYGKFTFDAQAKGTASIVINTGNAISTKLIEVKDARVVTSVEKANAVTLLQGATTDLEFVIRDQYTEVIKNADLGATHRNSDLTYKVEVKKASGDDNGLTVNSPALTGNDEDSLKKINVTAATNKTGSYNVIVTLLESGVEVSSATTKVTVAKNNVEGLVYNVSDVPTLAGDQNNTGTLDNTNAYAQEMKITAKDANGQTYVINSADIVSVTSSNASVSNAAKAADGKVYVAGNDVTSISTPAKEEKATITIKINTLDGIKTLTKEVTVSPVAPKVQEVKVVSAALSGATKDITGVTEKSVFTFSTNADGSQATPDMFVIAKDQYGVWSNETSPLVIVNSTNLAPSDAFTLSANKLTIDSGKGALVTPNKDIKVTISKELGSVQVTARVNSAGTMSLTKATSSTFTIANNAGIDLSSANSKTADIKSAKTTPVTSITGLTITTSKDFDTDAADVTLTYTDAGKVFTLSTVGSAGNTATAEDIVVTITHDATGLSSTITLTQNANGTVVVK